MIAAGELGFGIVESLTLFDQQRRFTGPGLPLNGQDFHNNYP
jgi:hypothetical protein